MDPFEHKNPMDPSEHKNPMDPFEHALLKLVSLEKHMYFRYENFHEVNYYSIFLCFYDGVIWRD